MPADREAGAFGPFDEASRMDALRRWKRYAGVELAGASVAAVAYRAEGPMAAAVFGDDGAAIEPRCPACGQPLRAADWANVALARCPACRTAVRLA
jgi:hypothetical protein